LRSPPQRSLEFEKNSRNELADAVLSARESPGAVRERLGGRQPGVMEACAASRLWKTPSMSMLSSVVSAGQLAVRYQLRFW
jgi:hypothetical protein